MAAIGGGEPITARRAASLWGSAGALADKQHDYEEHYEPADPAMVRFFIGLSFKKVSAAYVFPVVVGHDGLLGFEGINEAASRNAGSRGKVEL